MIELSYRLKNLRAERGFTQSVIASKLGTTTQNYCAYESGREPPFSKLLELCRIFNVTPNYLLGISEFRTPHEELAYLQGKNILAVNEELYTELATLPSFGTLLEAVYNYLHTTDLEIRELNQVILEKMVGREGIMPSPPFGFFDRLSYHNTVISLLLKCLDAEYKENLRKSQRTDESEI